MNIDDAVAILNAARHRGCDRWEADGDIVRGPYRIGLTPFEVVAIARAYEAAFPVPERRIDVGGHVVPEGWCGMLEW